MTRRSHRTVSPSAWAACVAAFVALAGVALVAGDADYRATALGWVPLAALLIVVVCDVVLLHAAARGLSFQTEARSRMCVRGESLTIQTTVHNKRAPLLSSVCLTFSLSSRNGHTVASETMLASFGVHTSLQASYQAHFDHIGVYRVGIESVEAGDCLGLVSRVVSGRSACEVEVLPRVVQIKGVRLSDDALLEASRQAKSVLADSQDYAYVRDYVIGDPLKSIHWNLSARAGEYYTRLYESAVNPGVTIVADSFIPDTALADEVFSLRDTVMESAVSLAHWARARGLDVDFRFVDNAGCQQCVENLDDSHLAQMMQCVPDAGEAHRACVPDALSSLCASSSGQGNVIVCSANVERDMVSALLQIKATHRFPLFVGACPPSCVDADRARYCQCLRGLEDAGVPCLVVSDVRELDGATLS